MKYIKSLFSPLARRGHHRITRAIASFDKLHANLEKGSREVDKVLDRNQAKLLKVLMQNARLRTHQDRSKRVAAKLKDLIS